MCQECLTMELTMMAQSHVINLCKEIRWDEVWCQRSRCIYSDYVSTFTKWNDLIKTCMYLDSTISICNHKGKSTEIPTCTIPWSQTHCPVSIEYLTIESPFTLHFYCTMSKHWLSWLSPQPHNLPLSLYHIFKVLLSIIMFWCKAERV